MDHLSLAQLGIYVAKTAIVLVVLVVAFRLLGKRQTGQMNIYDLAMIMALANAVQNAMTGGLGDIRIGLTSSSVLLLIGWGMSKLFLKSDKAERLVLGVPTVLINRGQVLEDRMRRERVTRDELLSTIRQHGLQKPSQVKLAVLEIDGSISIVPNEEN